MARKRIEITLSAILLLLSFTLKSQNKSQTYLVGNQVVNTSDLVNPKNFNAKAIETIVLDKINKVLKSRNKETFIENNILKSASALQARYMASIDDETLEQKNRDFATTALRVEKSGGSNQAKEFTEKVSFRRNSVFYSYEKLCSSVILDIFSSSKKTILLEDSGFHLIGISAEMNEKKNKIYISIVLGNFKSLNEGVAFKDKLKKPYSHKLYGLKPYQHSDCNRLRRNKNLYRLQKGLVVENGTIFFETDNVKALRRVIRKNKDALAVDILQKEQFTCENPNIIDYKQPNRGVLTKRVYAKRLFKKNIADIKENKYALKTPIATLPEGIVDNYELNLVLIKNKSFCQSLSQSFVIQTSGNYSRKVELLADTVTRYSNFRYKPVADSLALTLKIPFENKKYTYKAEDIEPFLKLLNEPAFLIYNLNIHAYSSIEGTDKENKFLQEERANSIINALKKRQKEDIATKISTDYNWKDFKNDIKATKHNILASMSMEDAQQYIREYNLKKELEPLFEKHRYAKIDMKITYDISGSNEEPFVQKKFKNAILDNDKALALSIQKFVIQQIENKRYDISSLQKMDVPQEKEYAGMQMNKIYMLKKYKQISKEEFIEQVAQLSELDSENEYITFNDLLNTVNYAELRKLVDDNVLIQNKIDRLYYSPLRKNTIDGLNVRYQFKLINAADSLLSDEKLRAASVNKIKEIVEIKEESMSNALKLAEIFIENNDFEFAKKSLDPWVLKTYSEKLLFTYVSLCSMKEADMHTQKFTKAMEKAAEVNRERYCKLFGKEGFSFIVLENKAVKNNYCKVCGQKNNMVELRDE